MFPSVIETRELTVSAVEQMYLGNIVAIRIPRFVNTAILKGVAQRFWESGPRRREPPAPGLEIGAHHFGKSLAGYFADVATESPKLAHVLGPDDPISAFQRVVSSHLGSLGLRSRLARSGDDACGQCVVRTWEREGSGIYDLGPHDDVAQLASEAQAELEIQKVTAQCLVATNLCIAQSSGGELVVWNHRSNATVRAQLGIEATGYPYPNAFLSGCESVELPMQPGDVVMLKGEYVHAVRRAEGRLVASYFAGKTGDSDTVVYWS